MYFSFLKKEQDVRTLSDFVERFNKIYGKIKGLSKFPNLEVSILPVEIPAIYNPAKILVMQIPNLDGIDTYSDHILKGYTEHLTLGINKELSIELQIQKILEMIVNTVERNKAFSLKNIKAQDLSMSDIEDVQQKTDIFAKGYTKILVNSLGSEKPENIFTKLLIESKRNIHITIRRSFIIDNKDRRDRYQIYKEIYERYDFVRVVIDNIVGVTTGRGFKFFGSKLESTSDPMLNLLDRFTTRSQLGKQSNHAMRDIAIYGDSYLLMDIYYDEISVRLMHPARTTIVTNGYLYEENGRSVSISKERVMHLNPLKWDFSGYGVSDLEPLVTSFLKIRYFEGLKTQIESYPAGYELEKELMKKHMADNCAKIIQDTIEQMKSIIHDPTSGFMKNSDNLYF